MVTVYDVEPNVLISKVADHLRSEVQVPEWALFVKTGAHKERPPEPGFWHQRAASILYQIYVRGPKGESRLARFYGGRKNRGRKPEHKVPAGRKIIRTILQQLEQAGYLEKTEKGRKITPKGISLLNKTAWEIWQSANNRTEGQN